MNLTFVMSHKVNGRSIKGEPSIDRLVEIRTVSAEFYIKRESLFCVRNAPVL